MDQNDFVMCPNSDILKCNTCIRTYLICFEAYLRETAVIIKARSLRLRFCFLGKLKLPYTEFLCIT